MLSCTQNGGGTYNVQTGRRDGLVSLALNVDLPPPFISVSDSIAAFAAKGLNVMDMVYLFGNLLYYLFSSIYSCCCLDLLPLTVKHL